MTLRLLLTIEEAEKILEDIPWPRARGATWMEVGFTSHEVREALVPWPTTINICGGVEGHAKVP